MVQWQQLYHIYHSLVLEFCRAMMEPMCMLGNEWACMAHGHGHYRMSATGSMSHWPIALPLGYSPATLVQKNDGVLGSYIE